MTCPQHRPAGIRGFTLIEILVAVAIIGVLASLAIPNFMVYRLRTKVTEARTIVGGIRAAQTSFVATHDNYAPIPGPVPPILSGPQRIAWPVVPCPITCSTVPADCNTFECIGFRPAGQVYYQYANPAYLLPGSPTGTQEFAIGVVGDVDGDATQASMSFQSANGGGVGLIHDGISACPLGLPPSQLFDCVPGAW